MADFSSLKRLHHPMPDFMDKALAESGLMDEYCRRPAYQQNDYIGWILRARQEPTRKKRLRQMLEELDAGGVYMGMAHPPSRK